MGYGGVKQESKVLLNVHKGIVQYLELNKIWGEGGEGQYLNRKHSNYLG